MVGERDGRVVIIAVNKAENRLKLYDDCRKLFNAAFEEKKQSRILFNHEDSSFTAHLPWANKDLVAKLHEDCVLEFYPSEEREIVAEVNWHECNSPIGADRLVATLDVYSIDGEPIAQYELFSQESIGYKITYRVRLALNALIKVMASHPFLTFIGIVLIFLCIPKRRRKVV
jgi:D-alanyl-D-alanine carboxypeptidase